MTDQRMGLRSTKKLSDKHDRCLLASWYEGRTAGVLRRRPCPRIPALPDARQDRQGIWTQLEDSLKRTRDCP